MLLAYRFRGDTSRRTLRPKRLQPALRYLMGDPFSGSELGSFKGSVLMRKEIDITLNPNSATVRHLIPGR